MPKIADDQLNIKIKKWRGLLMALVGGVVFWFGSSASIYYKLSIGNFLAMVGFVIAIIGMIMHFRIIFGIYKEKRSQRTGSE
jgi:ABC-type bacteriocin/lantibiotic exporter with double-glycine peptidase domain